jgi:hypothetical protein
VPTTAYGTGGGTWTYTGSAIGSRPVLGGGGGVRIPEATGTIRIAQAHGTMRIPVVAGTIRKETP